MPIDSNQPISAGTITCRSCGDANARFVLSLGRTPCDGSWFEDGASSAPGSLEPLTVFFCTHCSLVQLGEGDSPAPRTTGTRSGAVPVGRFEAADPKTNALELIQTRSLGRSSLVVDVGRGDQRMLQGFVEHGIPVVGIPSNREPGHRRDGTGDDPPPPPFTRDRAATFAAESGGADVVIERDALNNARDVNDFVDGIRILLKESGLAIFEVPYVRDLIERCAFDRMGHEQLNYFSVTALHHLFSRHSLFINHVGHLSERGDALRLYVARAPHVDRSVRSFLAQERLAGMDRRTYYDAFADRVRAGREWLFDLLSQLKGRGKRIVAYCVEPRGAAVINYLGTGRDLIDFIIDTHTGARDAHMAGTGLPVRRNRGLVDDMPDYCLLLGSQCAESPLKQEAAYLGRGGTFILPLPYPRLARDVCRRGSCFGGVPCLHNTQRDLRPARQATPDLAVHA